MQVTKYVSSNEKYIKADVEIEKGTDYEWVIERITDEELENQGKLDHKPCLWFQGQEKGFPLNKTNCRMLIDNFGSDETNDWVSRKVKLYRTMTSSPGGLVPCIRIRPSDIGAEKGPMDKVLGDDEDIAF